VQIREHGERSPGCMWWAENRGGEGDWDRKGRQGRVGALIRAVCTRACGPLENPTRESCEGRFLTVSQGADEFVGQIPSSLFRLLATSSIPGASSLA
jgi:hypothetical protein